MGTDFLRRIRRTPTKASVSQNYWRVKPFNWLNKLAIVRETAQARGCDESGGPDPLEAEDPEVIPTCSVEWLALRLGASGIGGDSAGYSLFKNEFPK